MALESLRALVVTSLSSVLMISAAMVNPQRMRENYSTRSCLCVCVYTVSVTTI